MTCIFVTLAVHKVQRGLVLTDLHTIYMLLQTKLYVEMLQHEMKKDFSADWQRRVQRQ